jgi:hypothetical protein
MGCLYRLPGGREVCGLGCGIEDFSLADGVGFQLGSLGVEALERDSTNCDACASVFALGKEATGVDSVSWLREEVSVLPWSAAGSAGIVKRPRRTACAVSSARRTASSVRFVAFSFCNRLRTCCPCRKPNGADN